MDTMSCVFRDVLVSPLSSPRLDVSHLPRESLPGRLLPRELYPKLFTLPKTVRLFSIPPLLPGLVLPTLLDTTQTPR